MIDVTHQISAVRRHVGSRVLEAGEARIVTLSQTYDTTVEDLWDACTNPERIPRWFLPISGDLVVGGRYELERNAGGTVQMCDPPHGFDATWEYGGDISWIEVRLTVEGEGGARFELRHIASVDDDKWDEFGPGAVGVGWDLSLTGLAAHLSSGPPVDPEEVAAWTASADGRTFVTMSSERWGEASIRAGIDEATAIAAARRTAAAYRGEGEAPTP